MKLFIAWIVAFIMTQSPPGRPTYVKEANETKEEAIARYESIATDVASVVSEEKPLFKGPTGRIKTALVILSIMNFESSFRRDVDLGLGKLAKGDGGKSVCLMQLNIGDKRTFAWNTEKLRMAAPNDPPNEVVEGWDQKELLADRKKCIRAGYRIIKMSFDATSKLPVTEWLRVYASGNVENGSQASKTRMNLALHYFQDHRPDFLDSAFMAEDADDDVMAYRPEFPRWAKSPLVRSIVLPEHY